MLTSVLTPCPELRKNIYFSRPATFHHKVLSRRIIKKYSHYGSPQLMITGPYPLQTPSTDKSNTKPRTLRQLRVLYKCIHSF